MATEQDEERIRQRAYDIWMREGCPGGKDSEHWDQAQRELSVEREKPASGHELFRKPAGRV